MVCSYELAQLSTTARKTPRAGAALLVLGSSNVDEILRGYYTKYDAGSADISPLGSISKVDIKQFQAWARDNWGLKIMDVRFYDELCGTKFLMCSRNSSTQHRRPSFCL